jgi:hypothetical protein
MKAQGGRVNTGLSGSLVLDADDGTVCGLVKAAGDRQPAEAWIVPSVVVLDAFPGLAEANGTQHPHGSAWWRLATRYAEMAVELFGSQDPPGAPPAGFDPPPSWWLEPHHRIVAAERGGVAPH